MYVVDDDESTGKNSTYNNGKESQTYETAMNAVIVVDFVPRELRHGFEPQGFLELFLRNTGKVMAC